LDALTFASPLGSAVFFKSRLPRYFERLSTIVCSPDARETGPTSRRSRELLFARNADCSGISEASLDGCDLIDGDIRGDLNVAVDRPIVASAAFMRGITTGRPGACGIFTTRRLNENVGPGNTVLLNEVFDGEVSGRTCFERCSYRRGAVVCHVDLSFFYPHMFKSCWRSSGSTPILLNDRYFGLASKLLPSTLRPE
jgi:hypothetical protein